MRVLIACEESQIECIEFRKRGHKAYSCDIQDCSGGYPEWHIKTDVLNILYDSWDLVIAHPPCTYLTVCGNKALYHDLGKFNEERYKKGLDAKNFFMKFYEYPGKICIENPVPNGIYGLPKYTQIINPWQFGDNWNKRTCLWLKNLPPLLPKYYVIGCKSYTDSFNGSVLRSKSFPGIAKAMAETWG